MSKQLEKKRKILEKLDQLDLKLDKLIKALEPLDAKILSKNPAPGKWSVIQVMHHLIRAERGSLGYLRKKMSFNPRFSPRSFSTTMRSWSLNLSLVLPLKYKSPSIANPQDLSPNTTLNETVLLWKSIRRELRTFLEVFDETLLDHEVYKHPYAGKMTLMHMLSFFENHFKRHEKQIKRILRQKNPG